MRLKKMQFLGAIKKVASSSAFIQNAKVAEKSHGEVGGWGRDPFSKNLMSPTPRRKW